MSDDILVSTKIYICMHGFKYQNFGFIHGYWVLVAKYSALKNNQNQTYSFVVYPK